MDIKITFPGGKKVYADMDGFVVETDQPAKYGGDGTAPSPYALFLASIGTCAGITVLGFCQERKIPTGGLSITQRLEYVTREDGRSSLGRIVIEIRLPDGFPEKYRDAVVRAAGHCAVKRTIENPPEFVVTAL